MRASEGYVMTKEPPVGALLAAIVQELDGPLGAAYLAAERARLRLERMQAGLGQMSRGMDALRWLAQALESPKEAPQTGAPAPVSQALATATRPTDAITADFPAGLAVLAGPGVLDAVLDNLLTYARKHSKRSRVSVLGRIVATRLPQWPASLELNLSDPLVWLTVTIDGPIVASGTSFFDPTANVGLWLARMLVRLHGGDLWCEKSGRSASFSSLWAIAPLMASDGWPDGRVEFGRAVREARQRHRLSRVKLSFVCGVADSTIRNIETGRHSYSQTSRERLLEGFAKLKKS